MTEPEIVERHRNRIAVDPHAAGLQHPYSPERPDVHDWMFYAPVRPISSSSITVTPDSRAPFDVLARAVDIRVGAHFIPGYARLRHVGPIPEGRRGELVKAHGLTDEEKRAWKEEGKLPDRRITFAFVDERDALESNPQLARRVERDWAEWAEAIGGRGRELRLAVEDFNRWTAVHTTEDLAVAGRLDDDGAVVVDRYAAGLVCGVTSEAQIIVELPTWEAHDRKVPLLPEDADDNGETGQSARESTARRGVSKPWLPSGPAGAWRFDQRARWRPVTVDRDQVEVFGPDDLCATCGGLGEHGFTQTPDGEDPRCQNCGGFGLRIEGERTWQMSTRPPPRSPSLRDR